MLSKGLLQIWELDCTDKTLTMNLGLCFDVGVVKDISWCPSGKKSACTTGPARGPKLTTFFRFCHVQGGSRREREARWHASDC